MTTLGYTNRSNVEGFLNRTFPELTDPQFNTFIGQAESYINNYLGYNGATTTSGILTENITREKVQGKLDAFDNLIVDVMHAPVHFDADNNPMVSMMEFNLGGVRVPLQLTDGTTSVMNTLLEVAENRRKILYPSIYFFPAISTVTPTAKVNLYNLRDVKFFIDVSYTGGYDEVPPDIEAATNYIVADLITRRDNPSMAIDVSQGSFRTTFSASRFVKGEPVSNAMARALELLQPYVRYTW